MRNPKRLAVFIEFNNILTRWLLTKRDIEASEDKWLVKVLHIEGRSPAVRDIEEEEYIKDENGNPKEFTENEAIAVARREVEKYHCPYNYNEVYIENKNTKRLVRVFFKY